MADMKMELSPQNNMLWGFQPPRLALLGGERICKHMEENSSQASVCARRTHISHAPVSLRINVIFLE